VAQPHTRRDTLKQSLALLATRRFGTFWFASLLSNVGTVTQQVAQPWLLLSLGASSYVLGLDAFASGAPVLLLTLVGGLLADRADRRRIIGAFQSIQMLCPTVLAILILTGRARPWMVVAMSLVVGITDALSLPSFQSIVPSIVPRSRIPAGIALNSVQFNLSRILGPTVAGLVMVSVGAAGAYAVSAASYVPFILVAWWVLPRRAPRPPGTRADAGAPASSVRAIWRAPVLRGALLSVLATSVLCFPVVTFCPVLVKYALHGDIGDFSLVVGAFGAGGLLGATALLAVPPEHDRRRLASTFALVLAAASALAPVVPWLYGLPIAYFLAGAAMTASNASANALLQSKAPAGIRGRSVGLFMLALRGGTALGGLATGVTVAWLGPRDTLALNGLLALLAHAAIRGPWLRAAGLAHEVPWAPPE
jgi:MFS family permease